MESLEGAMVEPEADLDSRVEVAGSEVADPDLQASSSCDSNLHKVSAMMDLLWSTYMDVRNLRKSFVDGEHTAKGQTRCTHEEEEHTISSSSSDQRQHPGDSEVTSCNPDNALCDDPPHTLSLSSLDLEEVPEPWGESSQDNISTPSPPPALEKTAKNVEDAVSLPALLEEDASVDDVRAKALSSTKSSQLRAVSQRTFVSRRVSFNEKLVCFGREKGEEEEEMSIGSWRRKLQQAEKTTVSAKEEQQQEEEEAEQSPPAARERWRGDTDKPDSPATAASGRAEGLAWSRDADVLNCNEAGLGRPSRARRPVRPVSCGALQSASLPASTNSATRCRPTGARDTSRPLSPTQTRASDPCPGQGVEGQDAVGGATWRTLDARLLLGRERWSMRGLGQPSSCLSAESRGLLPGGLTSPQGVEESLERARGILAGGADESSDGGKIRRQLRMCRIHDETLELVERQLVANTISTELLVRISSWKNLCFRPLEAMSPPSSPPEKKVPLTSHSERGEDVRGLGFQGNKDRPIRGAEEDLKLPAHRRTFSRSPDLNDARRGIWDQRSRYETDSANPVVTSPRLGTTSLREEPRRRNREMRSPSPGGQSREMSLALQKKRPYDSLGGRRASPLCDRPRGSSDALALSRTPMTRQALTAALFKMWLEAEEEESRERARREGSMQGGEDYNFSKTAAQEDPHAHEEPGAKKRKVTHKREKVKHEAGRRSKGKADPMDNVSHNEHARQRRTAVSEGRSANSAPGLPASRHDRDKGQGQVGRERVAAPDDHWSVLQDLKTQSLKGGAGHCGKREQLQGAKVKGTCQLL